MLGETQSYRASLPLVLILPTLPHPSQTLKGKGWWVFLVSLIFHVEYRTYNSPPGLNFKLSLWMWFIPFPWDSYFLFPAGPADSSNLHISATNFAHVPESPSDPVSLRPNSQSLNSFSPRNCREEGEAWDWKPCFQDSWTTKAICSFLLLLWLRWPCRVVSLETDKRSVCIGCHGEEEPKDDVSMHIAAWHVRCPELQESAKSLSSNH